MFQFFSAALYDSTDSKDIAQPAALYVKHIQLLVFISAFFSRCMSRAPPRDQTLLKHCSRIPET